MTSNNQLILEQIQTVANDNGLLLDENTEKRLLTTEIDSIKKFWAAGTNQEGGRVIVKIRPLNSIITKEEFIKSELRQRDIAESLSAAGIPAQRVLVTQFDVEPEWIIREFREGKPIGKMSIDPTIDQVKLFKDLLEIRGKLNTIDTSLIPGIHSGVDWQAKWKEEYQKREHFIEKYLGGEAAKKIRDVFENHNLERGTDYAIHNDMAPQNILNDNNQFFVIDWGEMASGPRAIDWATVWSFAIDCDELRSRIYSAALGDAGTDTEKKVTKNVFLLLGARLLASIAEYQQYRENIEQTEGDYAHLQKAWQNYQELLKAD